MVSGARHKQQRMNRVRLKRDCADLLTRLASEVPMSQDHLDEISGLLARLVPDPRTTRPSRTTRP